MIDGDANEKKDNIQYRIMTGPTERPEGVAHTGEKRSLEMCDSCLTRQNYREQMLKRKL